MLSKSLTEEIPVPLGQIEKIEFPNKSIYLSLKLFGNFLSNPQFSPEEKQFVGYNSVNSFLVQCVCIEPMKENLYFLL